MRITGLLLLLGACAPDTPEPPLEVKSDGIPLRFAWPDGASAEVVHTWDQVDDGVVVEEDWNAITWTVSTHDEGMDLEAVAAHPDLPTTAADRDVRAARTQLLTAGIATIDADGRWQGLHNPDVAWEAVQPSIAALGDALGEELTSADEFLEWRASDWERFFIADLAGLGVEVDQTIDLEPRFIEGYDRPSERQLVVADFAACPDESETRCVELEIHEDIGRADNTGATLLHRLWVEPATLQPHKLTISRVDFGFLQGGNQVATTSRSYDEISIRWTR